MIDGYYYPKRAGGQAKSITTHFNAGLNEYNTAPRISENHLSGGHDCKPNSTNDAIILGTTDYSTTNPYGASGTGAGYVVSYLSDYTGTYEYLHIITKDVPTGADTIIDDWHLLNTTSGSNSLTTMDISSYAITGAPCMGRLLTEAKRYICMGASGVKKLLVYDYSTITAVTLPCAPEYIATHYNRLFISDGNKLWWCKAGDPFSWYGLEEDDDKIVTSTAMLDSGTYTIAAQPDVPRPLEITVTATSTIDTLGTLTVVGTNVLSAAQTKTYTPIQGKLVCNDVWKTITSITAAGHSAVAGADLIKIGIAPLTGYVQDDSGYWCLENEHAITGLAMLNGRLFIGATSGIYVFDGYSYDTFQLTKFCSGVGNFAYACVESGKIYFIDNYEMYEFDGEHYPVIISHPVVQNGQVVNGIYGGIDIRWDGTFISSDGTYLYLTNYNCYDTYVIASPQKVYQRWIYKYDIQSRTWWRVTSIPYLFNSGSPYQYVRYIRRDGTNYMYILSWYYVPPDNAIWRLWVSGSSWYCKNYLVTKFFNEVTANDLTLTGIDILCRSYYGPFDDEDDDGDANLNIYYSTSSWADPYNDIIHGTHWTLLKSFTPSQINDELTTLHIPLVGSKIARQNGYILKIEWISGTYELEIFGIERQYRSIGRSR